MLLLFIKLTTEACFQFSILFVIYLLLSVISNNICENLLCILRTLVSNWLLLQFMSEILQVRIGYFSRLLPCLVHTDYYRFLSLFSHFSMCCIRLFTLFVDQAYFKLIFFFQISICVHQCHSSSLSFFKVSASDLFGFSLEYRWQVAFLSYSSLPLN